MSGVDSAIPGKGPCGAEALRRLGAERGSLGEFCSWTLLSLLATGHRGCPAFWE